MAEHHAPLVRVRDAHLVPDGGPARMVVTGLDRLDEVADAVAKAGGFVDADADADRLEVITTPSRLVDAAGRVGRAELAEPLERKVTAALEGWLSPPPDVETRVGPLACSRGPLVMGVVNVTPDSFSDGGTYFDEDDPGPAIAHGRSLVEAGADVIDVGGESTRPGAEPVAEKVERERVMPVVQALADDGVCVSVDTSKAAIAREAVEAGAAMINDVSAGLQDGLMPQTVAELDVPYVIMHMRGNPRTMQRDPRYDDVVAEVFEFLAEQVGRLGVVGVEPTRILIDPGIGFGKTVAHNLALLRRLRELCSLGRPVLVGASRKSFLGRISGCQDPADRLPESLAAAATAVAAHAAVVRAHDVEETVRAARVTHAIVHAPADAR